MLSFCSSVKTILSFRIVCFEFIKFTFFNSRLLKSLFWLLLMNNMINSEAKIEKITNTTSNIITANVEDFILWWLFESKNILMKKIRISIQLLPFSKKKNNSLKCWTIMAYSWFCFSLRNWHKIDRIFCFYHIFGVSFFQKD